MQFCSAAVTHPTFSVPPVITSAFTLHLISYFPYLPGLSLHCPASWRAAIEDWGLYSEAPITTELQH